MRNYRLLKIGMALILAGGLGCQLFSDHISRWQMLDNSALDEPLRAIGGDGIIYGPKQDVAMTREQLEYAKPEELLAYYAPVFIQQRVDSVGQPFPYPKEVDEIGEASLRKDADGKYVGVVSGQPRLYYQVQTREIDASEHIQLTYTAWYPAHPRMKTIDLESASVDSCVVRITLDSTNVPLFYETIAAGGFYHKIFVTRWVEDAARVQFGAPESGKTFSVERSNSGKIDWEVAGIVEESRDFPKRPVVFVRSGDHKVIGLGNRSRLKLPPNTEIRAYELTQYAELYRVRVDGSNEKKPFFDLEDGCKVYGAQRSERFLFSLLGVDSAGQPRANDQIKSHFDQSDWDDMTIYSRFLRLPPAALRPPVVGKPAAAKNAFMK